MSFAFANFCWNKLWRVGVSNYVLRNLLSTASRVVHRTLFRVAFAGLILIQVVLLGAFSAFVSAYWPSHVLIALAFAGLPLIGAGNYFLFQNLTRAESVGIEAEKWLARRGRGMPTHHPKWRKIVNRFAPWIPALVVVGMCSFLGETFAVASHMFRSRTGNVLRYRVSIPLTWIVTQSEPDMSGNHTWSLVTAMRLRDVVRAGLDGYLLRTPAPFFSEMAFYGSPNGDSLNARAPDGVVSTWSSPLAGSTITCWEYIPQYRGAGVDSGRFIRCSTPRGDFSCWFRGKSRDAQDFYRTLQSVRQTE
jgi:hypothetical protein